MWMFVIGYAVFIAGLVAYAAHVALSNKDKQRRADAFRVLKLLWGATTGVTAAVALMIQLSQAGLL